MTINEAEEKLLTILKQVMEEKLTASNVEVIREGVCPPPILRLVLGQKQTSLRKTLGTTMLQQSTEMTKALLMFASQKPLPPSLPSSLSSLLSSLPPACDSLHLVSHCYVSVEKLCPCYFTEGFVPPPPPPPTSSAM